MADIKRGAPFLVPGIAFMALGAAGGRIYLTFGLVFLVLGTVRTVRR